MMRTNNIQSLQALTKGYVGTAAPGKQLYFPGRRRIKKFSNVRVGDYTVDYVAPAPITWRIILEEMLVWYYDHVIQRERKRIGAIFSWVYGKPVPFPERQTSQLQIRLKQMFAETKCTFNQMADDIREYMPGETRFWRQENGHEVIVNSERILAAWRAVQEKKPFGEVAQILYF